MREFNVKWNVTEDDYEFLEKEVSLYPLYKKRLREAVEDIIHSTPERDTNGGGRNNMISRPTETIAFSLIQDARIRYLREFINAVEFAYNELEDEKQRFIQEIFWTRTTRHKKAVVKDYAISTTTYDRWKKGFLMRVGLISGIKRELL